MTGSAAAVHSHTIRPSDFGRLTVFRLLSNHERNLSNKKFRFIVNTAKINPLNAEPHRIFIAHLLSQTQPTQDLIMNNTYHTIGCSRCQTFKKVAQHV